MLKILGLSTTFSETLPVCSVWQEELSRIVLLQVQNMGVRSNKANYKALHELQLLLHNTTE